MLVLDGAVAVAVVGARRSGSAARVRVSFMVRVCRLGMWMGMAGSGVGFWGRVAEVRGAGVTRCSLMAVMHVGT